MNLFNRVFVSVLMLLSALFWLAVIFIIVAYPQEAISNLKSFAAGMGDSLTAYGKLMLSLAAGLLFLLSLLVFLVEIIPRRPSAVQLPQVSGGAALLTTEAIVQRIKHDVEQLPQVRLARPEVVSHGQSVDVQVELRADPQSDVSATAEEACGLVRESVEEKMGVKLRRLRVRVQHEPFPTTPPTKSPPTPQPPKVEEAKPEGPSS